MSDRAYVYGDSNGASYTTSGSDEPTVSKTHWDPRIEVHAFAGTVQVGIVPASERSTDDQGLWDNDDGQFLSLSRDGLNRLIEALQDAGAEMFGHDRW